MSIYEHNSISSASAETTASIGYYLTKSIYKTPLTILVQGELGAGKTTFAKGLAAGLGIQDQVVSPTFALEQRYNQERFIHIDLYRLSQTDAQTFLQASEDFPYIRLIEWPSSSWNGGEETTIRINIEERDRDKRTLHFFLNDVPLPTEEEIEQWYRDVHLQEHIIRHIKTVTHVAMSLADHLLARSVFVRRQALKTAALTHDLLRFVDFTASPPLPKHPAISAETILAHQALTQTPKQSACWKAYTDRYGQPHEKAGAKFLQEKGYAALGSIIETHGPPREGIPPPQTIEQKLLTYADKRVMFDTVVTLDERFDDFVVRYCNGQETDVNRHWRQTMKNLEMELFPEGPPL